MPSVLSIELRRRMHRWTMFGGVRFTTVGFDNLVSGSELNDAIDGSKGWSAPWVSRPFYVPGFMGITDMVTKSDGSTLSDGAEVDGTTPGTIWSAATVSRIFYAPGFMGIETFDTLTSGDVNGQGAGLYWTTTITARNFALSFPLGMEDFSSYADGSDVNTGSGGTSWGGAWVS